MGRRGMGRRAHKMEEKGQRMDGVSFGKRQAGRRGQPFPAELTETVRGFGGGLARILREHPSPRSSRRGSARVLRRRACQKPRLRVTQRKATPHGRSLRSAKLFHATDRAPISPTQPRTHWARRAAASPLFHRAARVPRGAPASPHLGLAVAGQVLGTGGVLHHLHVLPLGQHVHGEGSEGSEVENRRHIELAVSSMRDGENGIGFY